MTRAAKMLLGLATLAGLALLLQLYFFIDSYKQVDIIAHQNAYATSIQEEIDGLYSHKANGYLQADIEESDLDAIYHKLLVLEEEGGLSVHLIKEYNQVLRRFMAVEELNKLYQSDIIQADRVQINSPFVEGLTKESFMEAYPIISYGAGEDALSQTLETQAEYIKSQIEYYDQVKSELEDLEYIPLEIEKLNLIARAMAEAEEAYKQISNQTFVDELNILFQNYAQDFMMLVRQAQADGLEYSQLEEAVSPSQYLMKIIQGSQWQGGD